MFGWYDIFFYIAGVVPVIIINLIKPFKDQYIPQFAYNSTTKLFDLPILNKDNTQKIDLKQKRYERWFYSAWFVLFLYYFIIFGSLQPQSFFTTRPAIAIFLIFYFASLPINAGFFSWVGFTLVEIDGKEVIFAKIKPATPDDELNPDDAGSYFDPRDNKWKVFSTNLRRMLNREFVEVNFDKSLLGTYEGIFDDDGVVSVVDFIYAYSVRRIEKIIEDKIVKIFIKAWTEDGAVMTANQLIETDKAKMLHVWQKGLILP